MSVALPLDIKSNTGLGAVDRDESLLSWLLSHGQVRLGGRPRFGAGGHSAAHGQRPGS